MILAEERLRELLTRYPPETQHALAVFQDIQKECGYLPKEHIIDAAGYLSMPLARAYSIATFYRSFSLEPRGKYVIKVCDGTACHIKDSRGVLDCLKRLLGVELGETDADGLFTLEEVACLGCCALAPAMQVGDEYFGKLDDEKILEIITAFRAAETGDEAAESGETGGGAAETGESWGGAAETGTAETGGNPSGPSPLEPPLESNAVNEEVPS